MKIRSLLFCGAIFFSAVLLLPSQTRPSFNRFLHFPYSPPTNPSPTGTLSTPVIAQITATGFTISWSTSQALNTQLHYGAGNTNTALHDWTLATLHAMTVTGLQPGTTYTVQAESSYYSNPDLWGPVQSVTTLSPTTPVTASMSAPTLSGITSSGFTIAWTTTVPLTTVLHYGASSSRSQTQSAAALITSHSLTVSGLNAATSYSLQAESSDSSGTDVLGPVQSVTTAAASGGGSTPTSGARIFTAATANWLYSAPTGTGINISSITGSMSFALDTHDGGFDYPVAYTDGTHGCTTFTDTLIYNFTDHDCVPNPANGYWPSVGGWGANDGHLVVVNTVTGDYYDFWKLLVNSSGQPTSTNVGAIVHGNLATSNGTPGTTATEITGLAGDIMPGELDCVTCLNHALSVIVPGSMNSNLVGTQAPAVKTDGSVGGAIFREGAKIRFDPSVDVNTLNASTAVKAILRALQLYGGVITDQTGGSQIAFYTDLPSAPDLTGFSLIGQHLFLYY